MIKIESVEGICTITRDGEECVLFPNMQITPEEVETIVAGGDVVYCIDESQVVVVPKGEKATISTVEVTTEPAPVVVETTNTEETKEETKEETAPVSVVPPSVETPAPVAAKK